MGETDQLKTPTEEDSDLSKVADKPEAPAESGSSDQATTEAPKGYSLDAKPLKRGDVRGR